MLYAVWGVPLKLPPWSYILPAGEEKRCATPAIPWPDLCGCTPWLISLFRLSCSWNAANNIYSCFCSLACWISRCSGGKTPARNNSSRTCRILGRSGGKLAGSTANRIGGKFDDEGFSLWGGTAGCWGNALVGGAVNLIWFATEATPTGILGVICCWPGYSCWWEGWGGFSIGCWDCWPPCCCVCGISNGGGAGLRALALTACSCWRAACSWLVCKPAGNWRDCDCWDGVDCCCCCGCAWRRLIFPAPGWCRGTDASWTNIFCCCIFWASDAVNWGRNPGACDLQEVWGVLVPTIPVLLASSWLKVAGTALRCKALYPEAGGLAIIRPEKPCPNVSDDPGWLLWPNDPARAVAMPYGGGCELPVSPRFNQAELPGPSAIQINLKQEKATGQGIMTPNRGARFSTHHRATHHGNRVTVYSFRDDFPENLGYNASADIKLGGNKGTIGSQRHAPPQTQFSFVSTT